MQFVFTYIRKPVRLKRARQGCGLPARGARSEQRAHTQAGGGRTERSPRLPHRQRPPGKDSVCVCPSSSTSGKKEEKLSGGKNGEAGMSGGSSQLEGGSVKSAERLGARLGLTTVVPS